MRDIYLGDSYDLVKRFWFENLRSVAPLFAHPRFINEGIRGRYTTLTGVPILDLDSVPGAPFAILLDPHTGIPLATESSQSRTVTHATLPFMLEINRKYRPSYMVCFDQSYHRRHLLTVDEQREAKRDYLRKFEIASFYYVSHASFLFMSQEKATLDTIRAHLIELGIPDKTPRAIRLQPIKG